MIDLDTFDVRNMGSVTSYGTEDLLDIRDCLKWTIASIASQLCNEGIRRGKEQSEYERWRRNAICSKLRHESVLCKVKSELRKRIPYSNDVKCLRKALSDACTVLQTMYNEDAVVFEDDEWEVFQNLKALVGV